MRIKQPCKLTGRGSLVLKKALVWYHFHPLAVELLALVGVFALFIVGGLH